MVAENFIHFMVAQQSSSPLKHIQVVPQQTEQKSLGL